MNGTRKLGKNAEQRIKNIAKQNSRNNITSVSNNNSTKLLVPRNGTK